MTYNEINKMVQDKLTKIYKVNKVFFAFSDKQLKEGKQENNISNDNVIIRIGAGGFLPKENIEDYTKDIVNLSKWRKEQLKNMGVIELENAIKYELGNFECWYTGDASVVYGLFPEVAEAEIMKVYKKYANEFAN